MFPSSHCSPGSSVPFPQSAGLPELEEVAALDEVVVAVPPVPEELDDCVAVPPVPAEDEVLAPPLPDVPPAPPEELDGPAALDDVPSTPPVPPLDVLVIEPDPADVVWLPCWTVEPLPHPAALATRTLAVATPPKKKETR